MTGPDDISAAFRGRLDRFVLDAAFTVPASGVTALFGQSGSGKTTVLRCMAGLIRLDEGRCAVAGDIWQDGKAFRPTFKRPVGYVFQEASLFPHLSVTGNLLFATRGRRPAPPSDPIGFGQVVALLGLDRLLERSPRHLSGGERQRVAIGRALLSQPRLLLMDEPLSALDQLSKEEILPYLESLHRSLSIPVLYVSHDLAEIERLADTLVLMERGRVRGTGPIATMLADPDLPLLHMPRPSAVLDGTVELHDPNYRISTVGVPGGQLLVSGRIGEPGQSCRLRIPATDVSLGRQLPLDTSILNALPAKILGAEGSADGQMTVRLALGEDGSGAPILSRISRLSWDRLQLRTGETVIARIKAVALADPRSDPAALKFGRTDEVQ